MIYRFNKAQLERNMLDSLEQVVAVLQSENEAEIEVTALEFPNKLSVKLDEGPMFLIWDAEKKSYSGLTSPEPEPIDYEALDRKAQADRIQGAGPKPKSESEIDPVQLAQRTHDVIIDNLKMLPGQREVYHEALCNLWLKES